jgi:ribosomal protein L37AE/L43A
MEQSAAKLSNAEPKQCSACGGPLSKDSKGIWQAQLGGLLFVILGFGILFWLPPVGLILLLLAGHLLTRRDGLWRCRKCAAVFPRKLKWYDLS